MRRFLLLAVALGAMFSFPVLAGIAESRKAIIGWLDEIERTDRLWQKGSISGKAEQVRVLARIHDLPENVPDGSLDAAKFNCVLAGQTLANAMNSEQSLLAAITPDQALRWQRSLSADKKEFVRYAKECRRFATKAR